MRSCTSVAGGLLLSLALAANAQAGSLIGPSETVRKCKTSSGGRESCTKVGVVENGPVPSVVWKVTPTFVGRVARITAVDSSRWAVHEQHGSGFPRLMGYVVRAEANRYEVRSNGKRVGLIVGHDLFKPRGGVWNIFRPNADPNQDPRLGYVKRALPYAKGYHAAGAALGLNLLCTKRAPASCWRYR